MLVGLSTDEVTPVGAPGAVAPEVGVAPADVEGEPVPTALIADTRNR